jgi:hypothetical protein
LQAISTENGAVLIEGTSVWLESSRANPLRVLRGQVAEARREISCTKGFGPIWLCEGAGQGTRLPVLKIHTASVRDRLGALRIASSERLTFAGPS